MKIPLQIRQARKLTRQIVCTLFLGILLGTLLLTAVFSIPDNRIREHIASSVDCLNDNPYVWLPKGFPVGLVDYFAEARLLLQACNWTDEPALVRAVKCDFPFIEPNDGTSPNLVRNQAVIGIFRDGLSPTGFQSYTRYWCGVQTVLRPALHLLTYRSIRTANLLLTVAGLVAVCVLMSKRGLSIWYALAFSASLSLIGLTTVAFTVCLSVCFYIMIIACIIVLLFHDWLSNNNRYAIFFLIIGMATSFFDTLTWPLITLGMPLILHVLLSSKQGAVTQFKRIIVYACCWGIGYLGMWAGKWLVGMLVLDPNALSGLGATIQFRLNGEITWASVSMRGVIVENLRQYNTEINKLILKLYIGVLLVLFVLVLRKRKRLTNISKYFSRIALLCMIGVSPFIWYAVIQNHSIVHVANYPCRILAIAFFALLCIPCVLLSALQEAKHQKMVSALEGIGAEK